MTDVIDTQLTLQSDVECILLECHRDRPGVFAADMTRDMIAALAVRVAGHIGPLISGRYVPHRYAMAIIETEKRNAAVWAEFTGANYAALMKKWKISRRLVYAIIAQKRKAQLPQ